MFSLFQQKKSMNDDELNICKTIFNKLKSRKVFVLFWNNDADLVNPHIEHPVNFEIVSQKLDGKLYDSVSSFVSDVATVLENAIAGYENGSIKHAAAQQLSDYFEALLEEIDPFSGPVAMPLRYAAYKYLENKQPPGDIPKKQANKGKEPGSLIFATESDPDDLDSLYRDIKFLTSTTLSYEFAAFARQLQPDILNIQEEISLNIALLKTENRPNMRKFVTYLLRKAATGEVDAFARPFGQKVEPVRIYQRGFPTYSHATIVPLK